MNKQPPPDRTPYPGAQPFEEADAPFFAGRTGDVERVLEALHRSDSDDAAPLVILLGPPGVGRTSLLQAGILPALRNKPELWLPIGPLGASASVREATPLLAAHARRNTGHSGAQPVLLVDDLHDLLRVSDKPDEEGLELLGAMLGASGRPWRAVATMDATAFADWLSTAAAAAIPAQLLSVGPLDEAAIADAIALPAKAAGVTVAPELVSEILADLCGDGRSPRAADLAWILRRVWDQRGDDAPGLSHYHHAMGELRSRVRHLAGELAVRQSPEPGQLFDRWNRLNAQLSAGTADFVVETDIAESESVSESVTESVSAPESESAPEPVLDSATDAAWHEDTLSLDDLVADAMEAIEIRVPAAVAGKVEPDVDFAATAVDMPVPALLKKEFDATQKTEPPNFNETESASATPVASQAPVAGEPTVQLKAHELPLAAGPAEVLLEALPDRQSTSPFEIEAIPLLPQDEPSANDEPGPRTPMPSFAAVLRPVKTPPAEAQAPETPADKGPKTVESTALPLLESSALLLDEEPEMEAFEPVIEHGEQYEPPRRRRPRLSVAHELNNGGDDEGAQEADDDKAPRSPKQQRALAALELPAYRSIPTPGPEGIPPPEHPKSETPQRRRGALIASVAGVVVVGGALAWWMLAGDDAADEAPPPTRAAATTPAVMVAAAEPETVEPVAPAAVTEDMAEAQAAEAPAATTATPTAAQASPEKVAPADHAPPAPGDLLAAARAAPGPVSRIKLLAGLTEPPSDAGALLEPLRRTALPALSPPPIAGAVEFVRFAADGGALIYGNGRTAQVVALEDGRVLGQIDDKGLLDAWPTPDGQHALTLHEGGDIRLWPVAEGGSAESLGVVKPSPVAMRRSQVVWSEADSRALLLWGDNLHVVPLLPDGKSAPTSIDLPGETFRMVIKGPKGLRVLITKGNTLRLRRIRAGAPTDDPLLDRIAFSNSRRHLLAAQVAANLKHLITVSVAPSRPSPDGAGPMQRLYITAWMRNAKGWWATLRTKSIYERPGARIDAQASVAADGSVGKVLVEVTAAGQTRPGKRVLWRLANTDWTQQPEPGSASVLGPRGRKVLRSPTATSLALYPNGGKEVPLPGPPVGAHAFNDDATRMATGHKDGSVNVWATDVVPRTLLTAEQVSAAATSATAWREAIGSLQAALRGDSSGGRQ